MREYTGVLRTVGAGTYENSLKVGANTVTTHSYIEIGDQILKKVKAYTGINGELQGSVGEVVTIYVQGSYLVGIKTEDGRTYASEGDNMALNIFLFLCMLIPGIVLLVAVFGLIFLFGAWMMWGRISAQMAARSLPNAILI